MQKRFCNVFAIVLVAASVGACSPSRAAAPPPGTLPPESAQVTINGHALPETHTVKCIPMGSLTAVTIGDAAAGTKVFVSNESALVAKSVNISDLDGFTGSYAEDLQGAAEVALHGYTYTVRGRAEGFNTDNPSLRATGTFTIKVAC
ncbi:MAG TPA: lipoprotein LpqH [Mycobacterium sp.]|nr:lipoprotein LpqH [Mycobacterium sp.]